MRSTASVSFIFVSDTHVGSNYGICSPAPALEGGDYYRPTEEQFKLYKGFQECCAQISQPNKIKALFLGGDLVDGVNPKKSGKDLWTVDPVVAMFDFDRIMAPLASKAELVFGIRGSDYHVSPDRTVINYDELACQMIGSLPYGKDSDAASITQRALELKKQGKLNKETFKNLKQSKKESGLAKKLGQGPNIFKKELDSLDSDNRIPYPVTDVRFKGIFNGTGIVLKHHVSFSPNYMYRGTGLTRNDMLQTLQKDRHFPDGYNSIIYAYGHAHYYHYSGNATHHNFVIPCWKRNDTHLKQYGITEPDFGIVEVIVEPNDQVIVLPYVLRGEQYPAEKPYIIK